MLTASQRRRCDLLKERFEREYLRNRADLEPDSDPDGSAETVRLNDLAEKQLKKMLSTRMILRTGHKLKIIR